MFETLRRSQAGVFQQHLITLERRLADVRIMRSPHKKFPTVPNGTAGKGGSVPRKGAAPGRNAVIDGYRRRQCDSRHNMKIGRKNLPASSAPIWVRADPKSTDAKWGPASLPTPTIRYPSGRCPLASSRSTSLAISGPQNDAYGAFRSYPAMVWSAPFRGPAAPGKPFIISSCVCRNNRCPSDGLHFLPDRVRFNSWESLRSVIGIDPLPRQSVPFSSS